jgi:hypothetical protein
VLLSLTSAGREAYAKALKAIASVDRLALEGVAVEGLEAMARSQQSILANLAPNAARARRLIDWRRE